MRCEWWESVSALADGEVADAERAEVETHLESCRACQDGLRATTDLLARIRLSAVADTEAVPTAAALTPGERRWLRTRWARIALVAAGLAIVAFAVPESFQGDTKDSAGHVARHLATWQIGFGVGLVVAAVQSRFSQAMLAMAGAVALLTVVTTVVDVAFGHRGPWAESVHVVELIGIVLLWLATPPHLRPHRSTRPAAAAPPVLRVAGPNDVGTGTTR